MISLGQLSRPARTTASRACKSITAAQRTVPGTGRRRFAPRGDVTPLATLLGQVGDEPYGALSLHVRANVDGVR